MWCAASPRPCLLALGRVVLALGLDRVQPILRAVGSFVPACAALVQEWLGRLAYRQPRTEDKG
jgi:hypothetical protein